MELSPRLTVLFCILTVNFRASRSMFTSLGDWLSGLQTNQRNYGISIVDVDHDGKFEMFVAGYDGPNLVLKYNEHTKRFQNLTDKPEFAALKDPQGQAIGVCSCDIDGDGKEEIYVLNTNQAYSGKSTYGDKIFKWRDGKYVDLYSDTVNDKLDAKNYAGRSVACVDRFGNGKYAFILATYSENNQGKFALIEMDSSHPGNDVAAGKVVLKNVANDAGIDRATGGRGITVGPIVNDQGRQDIFFDNEGNPYLGNPGNNFLFKNNGDGTFTDVAEEVNIVDGSQNGRGVALADFNTDGLIDIAYGNWMGPHRLFIQSINANGQRKFTDKASRAMAIPSPIRTVMAVDFDNDANLEVFYNNIVYRSAAPNKLFRVTSNGPNKDVDINELPIGDALEPNGYGTGGAYHDFDGDGFVELALAHGESNADSLSLYKVSDTSRAGSRNWIRILPMSKFGAPARGASVTIKTSSGTDILRVIDAGSGYLCQMEPIAHFGLAAQKAIKMRVQWPDGKIYEQELKDSDQKKLIQINYPGSASTETGAQSAANGFSAYYQRVPSSPQRSHSYSLQRSRSPPQRSLSASQRSLFAPRSPPAAPSEQLSWDIFKRNMVAKQKAQTWMEFLRGTSLRDDRFLPLWAFNLEKLPSWVHVPAEEFFQLKKKHARETAQFVMERLVDYVKKAEEEEHKILAWIRSTSRDDAEFYMNRQKASSETNDAVREVMAQVRKEQQKFNRISERKLKRRLGNFGRRKLKF